jgi:hypothetical protein
MNLLDKYFMLKEDNQLTVIIYLRIMEKICNSIFLKLNRQ